MNLGLDRKSVAEFFREGVEKAQRRQKVDLLEVTQFYIVNLLSHFIEAGKESNQPLALILKDAMETDDPHDRFRLMKAIGDKSLYVSGFFPDSLKRKIVDIDYYMGMGEQAYRFVSQASRDDRAAHALAEAFDELARKFTRLVDLIAEISEQTGMTSDTDILRLYERWLATKSDRLRELLNQKGIVATPFDREPMN